MAYTTPDTAVTGVVAPASMWNSGVRDNLLAMMHPIARKTADESVTSSTVLQDDDHLSFAIGANEKWLLEYHILAVNTTTTQDYKIAWSVPTGAVTYRHAIWNTGGVLTLYFGSDAVGGADILTSNYDATDNDGDYIPIKVAINNGANAGTVMLRWAQQTSGATASTFRTNSTLWGAKLA